MKKALKAEKGTWEEVFPNYFKPFKVPAGRSNFEANYARLQELGLKKHPGDAPWEITPLPGSIKTPIAEELSKLSAYRKVRFFDEGLGNTQTGFYIKEVEGEIRVIVSNIFFENPNAALAEIKTIENKLNQIDRLARQGIKATIAPFSFTDKIGLSLEIPKERRFSSSDPRQWIKNRAARHGVKVVVDDSKFVGEVAGHTAFARYGTVYLRSDSIENLEANGGVAPSRPGQLAS